MAIELAAIATIVSGLVEGARLLSANFAKDEARPRKTDDRVTSLEERVDAIAAHEKEQAELVAGLGEQLKNLVTASERLEARAKVATWLASAALLVSAGAVLVLLVR